MLLFTLRVSLVLVDAFGVSVPTHTIDDRKTLQGQAPHTQGIVIRESQHTT